MINQRLKLLQSERNRSTTLVKPSSSIVASHGFILQISPLSQNSSTRSLSSSTITDDIPITFFKKGSFNKLYGIKTSTSTQYIFRIALP